MKKRYMSYRKKQQIAPYFFVTPYFLVFIMFSLFPIIYTFYISLTNWTGITKPDFVGIANYLMLFKDKRFWHALVNNLQFVVMILPIQLSISFLIALLLNHKLMVWKKGFRILSFLPYLTTPVALGVIFGILFDSHMGQINVLLEQLGGSAIAWTTKPWPAKIMIVLITIWRYAGYTSILFMAGMTNIDPQLYEASEIDGASFWQQVRNITIPLLRPITVFVIVTNLIGNFQMFEEPYMIFTATANMVGGPDDSVLTGVWYFYDTAFSNQLRFGYGAAIGVGMFFVIAVLSLTANKVMQKGEKK
ncbi:MAG: sugar ABC transporter permease [Eubacteriales bacterium]|nr:sugar ABC transporter permease [Eubacteriales bacterium]